MELSGWRKLLTRIVDAYASTTPVLTTADDYDYYKFDPTSPGNPDFDSTTEYIPTTETTIPTTTAIATTTTGSLSSAAAVPVNNGRQSQEDTSIYPIMGGVIAVIGLIILMIVGCFVWRRMKRSRVFRLRNRECNRRRSSNIYDEERPVSSAQVPVPRCTGFNQPMYGMATPNLDTEQMTPLTDGYHEDVSQSPTIPHGVDEELPLYENQGYENDTNVLGKTNESCDVLKEVRVETETESGTSASKRSESETKTINSIHHTDNGSHETTHDPCKVHQPDDVSTPSFKTSVGKSKSQTCLLPQNRMLPLNPRPRHIAKSSSDIPNGHSDGSKNYIHSKPCDELKRNQSDDNRDHMFGSQTSNDNVSQIAAEIRQLANRKKQKESTVDTVDPPLPTPCPWNIAVHGYMNLMESHGVKNTKRLPEENTPGVNLKISGTDKGKYNLNTVLTPPCPSNYGAHDYINVSNDSSKLCHVNNADNCLANSIPGKDVEEIVNSISLNIKNANENNTRINTSNGRKVPDVGKTIPKITDAYPGSLHDGSTDRTLDSEGDDIINYENVSRKTNQPRTQTDNRTVSVECKEEPTYIPMENANENNTRINASNGQKVPDVGKTIPKITDSYPGSLHDGSTDRTLDSEEDDIINYENVSRKTNQPRTQTDNRTVSVECKEEPTYLPMDCSIDEDMYTPMGSPELSRAKCEYQNVDTNGCAVAKRYGIDHREYISFIGSDTINMKVYENVANSDCADYVNVDKSGGGSSKYPTAGDDIYTYADPSALTHLCDQNHNVSPTPTPSVQVHHQHQRQKPTILPIPKKPRIPSKSTSSFFPDDRNAKRSEGTTLSAKHSLREANPSHLPRLQQKRNIRSEHGVKCEHSNEIMSPSIDIQEACTRKVKRIPKTRIPIKPNITRVPAEKIRKGSNAD